ncbi:glycosyltransferase [Roseitranquillus sediminis]|uniref:glycosyltransferase n=1 Tax=Roseitranquillus sediminis TaxID=2809051 RepID=UPI001D0C3B13|nr:glycosyltransferase [Roseitranquillus sediminis]MBM9594020.1 glycosyltransferase [Roseitranquillus sediminis]
MTRRVLHVTPYLDAAAGGPPVVVERLAEGADPNGYAARILTSAALTEDGGAALGRRHGVAVVPSQARAIFGSGQRRVAEIVRAVDIVHLHTLWSPLVAAAAAAARRAGVPYVLSPHGMAAPWSTRQKSLRKRIYWGLVERRTVANAARVVFTSAAERDQATLLEAGARTAVIPLGADAPPAPRAELAAAFLAEHPDLVGRPLLLFLGRLHPKKRPEALVAAMPAILTAVPNAVLLFVGGGERRIVQALTRQAQELGLGSSVRLLGPRTGVCKWRVLAAASLFTLPSQQENFAIAAAEALRSGVPVLTTRQVDIWQEIVAADAGRALDETDIVGSIAREVVALLGDGAAAAAMSENAVRLAESTFTWHRCAERTHVLYDEVRADA